MRRRKGPVPSEIVTFHTAKAAAGGSGSGSGGGIGGHGYKPGDTVICKIQKAERGGYAVTIPKNIVPAYLPTPSRHNIGDEVLAVYVCMDKSRVLLQERFAPIHNIHG